MAKSIMQNDKECYFCGTNRDLECHHIFLGTANRKLSEKYGLKVWLCHNCHTGDDGVHFNKKKNMLLQAYGQKMFQIEHQDEDFKKFISIFGKNYIDENIKELDEIIGEN